MSQAEALLDNLVDDDGRIVIDSERQVSIPKSLCKFGVQHDHNVTTRTFTCPRYWGGLDMSTMRVYINYVLSNGYKDSYPADNVDVDDTDNTVMHFSWMISRNVTQVKGNITFLVCIKKTDTDGNEVNHWNSELSKSAFISEGLECQEQVVEENSDLITKMLLELDTTKALASKLSEEIKGKLDKCEQEGMLYGTEPDSPHQRMIPYSQTPHGDTIVMRCNGNVSTGNPIGKNEATPKEYVDLIKENVNLVKTDVRTLQQQQRQMEVRIANAEALGGGVLTTTEKVEGKSRVEVSENALPYATVDAIFGNCSLKSVNVLPYDYNNGSYQSFYGAKSINVNGLTFTQDHIGRIVVSSGSPSAKIDFWLFDSSFGFKPKNGTYIGSGCPAGGSTSTYRLRFIVVYNDGKPQSTFYDYGDGRGARNSSDGSTQIIIDDTVKCMSVTFQVFTSAYLSFPRNVLPQLQPGTTITEWEPYQYKLTFADLYAIESYDANDNLVDTFEVPEEIRNLPDYGVDCVYHFSLWDRYPEHCSLYGYGNAVDLVNKKYYRVAGVTYWSEGLDIPYASDNGVTDGIKFANGGGSMYEADISEYITDNYIKVSAGGYLVLKTDTGVPCSIYLTYQSKVVNE